MDRFTELEVFTRIADEASLTRVADQLGLSVSGVSRCLNSLENRLGVRLVQRTTRQLSLTLEGRRFAGQARDILGKLNAAEESVSAVKAEPLGTLKVGASLAFSLIHLLPIIRQFKLDYPAVTIDLQIANRYGDIVESGLDVAIRTRRIEADSSHTIRKLAEVPRILTAAPSYIAAHGAPSNPDEIESHALLLYTLSDDWDHLTFHRNGITKRLPVTGELTCNDGMALKHAALDGMGILVQPAYVVQAELNAGRLVEVMPDWRLQPLTMNVAFPSRANMPARTRLFIDALVRHIRENDLERVWSGEPDFPARASA
ncbi:LysR family transcriptional regulator [Allorhizobium sp. BGMRC 0089]|uniref:LysR family transcriptional regulator n=1 Tax=Allorhizobium sonneratiae TaxID=2934936 RepID=UPI002033B454|nr:LysR family transcriptional regulator [Allorhizobium sonneratiae]MCM2292410.1 LysR family transcriptional regulator [Allorhizobium sonneratiae]